MAAGVDFYLHSNMDRFEIFRFRLLLRFSYIYIPIWIDLKVTEDCGDGCVYVIYIPIWIDLKAGHTATVDALKEIYIPIWIDLKQKNPPSEPQKTPNLHSNMDRFERTYYHDTYKHRQNLHSNMDRFESAAPIVQL